MYAFLLFDDFESTALFSCTKLSSVIRLHFADSRGCLRFPSALLQQWQSMARAAVGHSLRANRAAWRADCLRRTQGQQFTLHLWHTVWPCCWLHGIYLHRQHAANRAQVRPE